jgi:hypothetical protein
MRFAICVCLLFLTASVVSAEESKLPLVFADDFEKGDQAWQPTDKDAWRVVNRGNNKRYYQVYISKYKPPHRSPLNISLVKDVVVSDFVLEADCLSTADAGAHRDMCLFFNYQDPAHFYYVHIAPAPATDEHANKIFVVNAADRKMINETVNDGNEWKDVWYHVKIVRDTASGKIEIYRDDMQKPIMTATDKTFTWGQVGIGSFDDNGMWDNFSLHGAKVEKK